MFERLSLGECPKLPFPEFPQEYDNHIVTAQVVIRMICDAPLTTWAVTRWCALLIASPIIFLPL